jgi:hypothetical protein
MKEEFTLENFFKALKTRKDSPLAFVVEDIFDAIMAHKDEDLSECADKDYDSDDFRDFFWGNDQLFNTFIKYLKLGWNVYVGSFPDYDFDRPAALYLCYSSFLVSGDKIYFNSEDSGY